MNQSRHRPILYAIILLFIVSANAFSQEKQHSICEPLPEERQFLVLGYTLGACKTEVEKIIEDKGFTPSKHYKPPLEKYYRNFSETYGLSSEKMAQSSEKMDLEMSQYYSNRDAPEGVSFLTTNYIDGKIPYEEKQAQRIISLAFYNNTLYGIDSRIAYSSIDSNTFVEIIKLFRENLREKYGKLDGAKESAEKGENWIKYIIQTSKVQIILGINNTSKAEINLQYILLEYADTVNKLYRDMNEQKKKKIEEKEKEQRKIEGF